ncbi:hypothetical protein MtrunA17_Chr4g0059741 [Medicago truncatula]|uniref:Uncharacterized protein n=2 Tax=Medicago truncatula TaxID=3880 RepID=A0A396IFI4_MEDTR|nr:uncharacterized protein LOC25493783 [Medicago truncatula]RHN63571.1 hypothetical protein MtrunA17_Chr4g0059741 [Medicago truncatula]
MLHPITNNNMDYSIGKSKNEESLCEKSMKVVVNVIRLSSFSIAQRTLGVGASTTRKSRKDKDLSDSEKEPMKEKLVSNKQFPASSRRSQQPQSRANPTYVIKSVGSNRSTEYLIHKERLHDVNPNKELCVDGLASDYISKIRNKLGRSL